MLGPHFGIHPALKREDSSVGVRLPTHGGNSVRVPTAFPGIQYGTAIGNDPSRNPEPYTQTLGLRLVKQSANQDDISVLYLFYGDHGESPGSSMTFFPYSNARPGRVGTGQASAVQFLIPEDAINYWRDRLVDAGVDAEEPFDGFGDIRSLVRWRGSMTDTRAL